MKQHVARTAAACFYHIHRLRQIRRRVGQEVTQQLVLALIMSRLDYCNSMLAGSTANVHIEATTARPECSHPIGVRSGSFSMSSAGCSAGCQSLAPFTNRVVSHFLVQTVPFLLDTLARFFHVRDPVVLVHMLLWDPLHRVVDGVQIRTVRRPQRRRIEVRRQLLHQLDGLLCLVCR